MKRDRFIYNYIEVTQVSPSHKCIRVPEKKLNSSKRRTKILTKFEPSEKLTPPLFFMRAPTKDVVDFFSVFETGKGEN